MEFKIFRQNNYNDIENELNEFMSDIGDEINIIHMNTVSETVSGIPYLTIIIYFEFKKE